MNIHNREEFLKESLSVIKPVLTLSLAKGIEQKTIDNIDDMLILCVKYGFSQGEIYGNMKGKIEASKELGELIMRELKNGNGTDA